MKIYHNPRCTKSRQSLALLRENNTEPDEKAADVQRVPSVRVGTRCCEVLILVDGARGPAPDEQATGCEQRAENE